MKQVPAENNNNKKKKNKNKNNEDEDDDDGGDDDDDNKRDDSSGLPLRGVAIEEKRSSRRGSNAFPPKLRPYIIFVVIVTVIKHYYIDFAALYRDVEILGGGGANNEHFVII